jgi:hypothetical protein
MVGEESDTLRAEFIVLILDASKRLGLCTIPAIMWPGRRSSGTNETTVVELEDEDDPSDFSDLMPSEHLTY